jgi:hypothetical protein
VIFGDFPVSHFQIGIYIRLVSYQNVYREKGYQKFKDYFPFQPTSPTKLFTRMIRQCTFKMLSSRTGRNEKKKFLIEKSPSVNFNAKWQCLSRIKLTVHSSKKTLSSKPISHNRVRRPVTGSQTPLQSYKYHWKITVCKTGMG